MTDEEEITTDKLGKQIAGEHDPVELTRLEMDLNDLLETSRNGWTTSPSSLDRGSCESVVGLCDSVRQTDVRTVVSTDAGTTRARSG